MRISERGAAGRRTRNGWPRIAAAALLALPALVQADEEGVSEAGARSAGPPAASGSLALGTTSVSGNRELPRVMVVVPWKRAEPARLGGRPIVSLVEEALTPVDPEVFRRRLEYYALLHGGKDGNNGKSALTATNLTEE
jgi:hypothetical protein